MKKSKFSEEQIVFALRQAEGGTPVYTLYRTLQPDLPRRGPLESLWFPGDYDVTTTSVGFTVA